MAITARLIGRLGGRSSQEFSVGSTTVTRSVGEGRWLASLGVAEGRTDPYIDGVPFVTTKVISGPATVRFRSSDMTATGYITPLD